MKYLFVIFTFIFLFSCQGTKKKETTSSYENSQSEHLKVLLIGTFHFNNFNPENNGDIIQTKIPDILTEKNQLELELITKKIEEFNPSKIFVEFPFSAQNRLDSIYDSFSENDFSKVRRDEIRQIAFRTGKALNHNKLFAMDLRTNFPIDSLFIEMEKASQLDLIKKDSIEVSQIEKDENELFASNKPLSEILFYFNENKRRKEDINWYLSLANQGGKKTNFVGSYLTSEWYKRNLYMYSLIQKSIEKTDDRIMILAGASHIAMFKDFIDYNPEWKSVELKEIMKK